MGKPKEEKSDDIEIISVGKMYSGPWDKKYWSSSRGKDRYPYPVGYKSFRVQNGITYKMEILEGLKGPLFSISSTDGNSCSGDTPDIAWENFQKKGCSQIKLWRGKRFTCKINGVELYGFKNPFVQRLLRELVANVSGTEHSLLTSNFSSRAPNTVDKLQTGESDPDSIPCLVNTQVAKKRGRTTDKIINTKQLAETHSKEDQYGKSEQEAIVLNSRQRDKSDGRGSDPSVSPAMECLSIAERRVQLDTMGMSDHPKSHRSISEETYGDSKAEDDMPVLLTDANLCAPDTLDHAGDSLCAPSLENHEQITRNVKEAIVNDQSKSGILLTDSHPEDERGMLDSNTFSETCDTDSVGQEIAKSMMTVLLPRAVPLLKTFTRKKKKSPKPQAISTHGCQEKKNVSNSSVDDGLISRKLAEQSDFDRQKKSNICSTGHDSFVSTSGYTQSVVPDSYDYDDPVDSIPYTSKADIVTECFDTRAQITISKKGDATTVLCFSGTKEHEINLHSKAQNSSSEKPPKGPILAPETEITANLKRRRRNCPSIHKPPSIPAYVDFSKNFEARFSEKLPNEADLDDHVISTSNLQESSTISYHNVSAKGEIKDGSRLNIQQSSKLSSNPQGLLDLFACYVLPMPISTVHLIVKENDVYVCVKCCSVEHEKTTLFVYKTLKRGENMGCPSLIGYLSLGLESSKDTFDDYSLLQFIPDEQLLVVGNKVRIPFCRESKLHCLCSACTSDSFKKNAVKIVRINSGYASLVTRLEITQDVRCVLVCEPSFLLTADEVGKLELWAMNSSWSAQIEHWYLPTHESIFPCIVELKRVPKSPVLVIGHNGFGEFGLWDIEKRTLVSRFSSPGMSVSKCIPACLFKWQKNGEHSAKELMDEIMDATKKLFAEKSQNHNLLSLEYKDAAIWLLISTVSDPDSQCYQSSEQQDNPVEYLRLALLVNNTVIVGSALESGVAAVTSGGRGIMGTCDGLVYMWELSTGKKLGNLHSFRGSSVSCITSDTSNSGAVAIACGSQLLVYLPS